MTFFRLSLDEAGLSDVAAIRHLSSGIQWSHNGIVLPRSTRERRARADGTGSRPVTFYGSLTLNGPLRPDLSISRRSLQAVPFAVHSAIHLAVRTALDTVAIPPFAKALIGQAALFPVPPAEHCSTRTVRADPLLAAGAWNDHPVIPLADGMVSVTELLARVGRGESTPIPAIAGRGWAAGSRGFSFYRELGAALLHLFVPLTLVPGSGLHARRVATPVEPMSELLPPLFAVPFDSGDDLARAGSCLNAAHPLTRWISDNAAALARDFAAPFNRVFRRAPFVAEVDDVNDALDRVARARTSIPVPPAQAYVRADENGWWVSR